MRVIGYLLIICGIISLPGFLMRLPNAHHGYQLVGEFVGYGLVFYLAYLCLRKKKSTNITEEPVTQSTPSELISTSSSFIVDLSTISSNVANYNVQLLNELKQKCNPKNFMEPYDYDKVYKANNIFPRLLSCDPNDYNLVKDLRLEAEMTLDIRLNSEPLFKELSLVCNPAIYADENHYNAEKVALANEFYQQIVLYKDDFTELEIIKDKAIRAGFYHQIIRKSENNRNEDNDDSILFYWIIIILMLVILVVAVSWGLTTYNSSY